MNNVTTGMVFVPGIVALLVFLVFTYLYEQSRQGYFRAWQLAWAAYTLHYALEAIGHYRGTSAFLFFLSSLLLVAMAICIFVSTRLMRGRFRFQWYDGALALAGTGLAYLNMRAHMVGGVFSERAVPPMYSRLEIGLAAVLFYCSLHFYLYAHRRNSLAFRLLAFSLALWAALMGVGQVRFPFFDVLGQSVDFLGPIPQMLLAIAMVMVLAENQRNAVQEMRSRFRLSGRPSPPAVRPRPCAEHAELPRPAGSAAADASSHRVYFGAVARHAALGTKGIHPEFLEKLQRSGAGDYLAELAYRRGGVVTFHRLAELDEPLPAFPGGRFAAFKETLLSEGVRDLMAVSLQTREHNFGVILFPHAESRMFGSSNLRLLIGLTLQIALTLENYVVMHDAQRRTKEYELLTEIGQAISSHLDQDEVLRTVHLELGQIFDTSGFYIAFQEDDEIRFELEIDDGQVLPKRSRPVSNGLTEHIIRTGQPLLIQSDLEQVRAKLGTDFKPPFRLSHFARCRSCWAANPPVSWAL